MKPAKNPKRVEENFVFQRRNPIRNHFVNTSKVLLYGYQQLSDNAKITYQVIDGYDWEDKETGDSKGYAFPATDTLAQARGVSKRTIERHIAELEGVGLITRQQRKNLPSVLYIEEVSEEEIGTYLRQVQQRRNEPGQVVKTAKRSTLPQKQQKDCPATAEAAKMSNDKNDVSREPNETTKMTFAYSDEIRRSEEQQQAVVAQLEFWKIGKRKVQELVEKHPPDYLTQKLKLLNWKLEHRQGKRSVDDPAAWLIQAIEEDFQPPPRLEKHQEPRRREIVAVDEREGVVIVVEQARSAAPPY